LPRGPLPTVACGGEHLRCSRRRAPWPVGAAHDAITSTRWAHETGPPITSFTFTEIARMPGGIVGGADARVFDATLLLSGSFSATGAITPRSPLPRRW
jgi:hypothetical protein